MAEQRKYQTKQQKIILNCLKKQRNVFCTVEQFMEYFHQDGIHIGQTTVYRALDRLTEERKVIKIPSVNGSKAQYRYIGEQKYHNFSKMVCLKCGRVIPLEYYKVIDFSKHICEEYDFELDEQHMILFGYCDCCKKQ